MVLAIKKRQEKKGKKTSNTTTTTTDPFLEINRYFSQSWLRWEDCPNPISWWGVSLSVLFCYIGFNHVLVPTWRSSSSDDGMRLFSYSSNNMHSREIVFSFGTYQ
jgi:hypothetical protein